MRQKRIPFYRLGRLIKFDEQEVLAHYKVEAENNESSQKQTGQRITIRKGGTIDLHRPDSGLTSEQRKRYKALLGME